MHRVSIRGCSGAGKSSLARQLADRLGVPHVELDALYHLEGWRPRDDESFREVVEAATSGPSWVADGNYRVVQPTVARRADTVVWLDLPRWLVLARVVRRTVTRLVTRRELWNGNRESVGNLVSPDPEHNIVLWAWTRWPDHHRRAMAAVADPVPSVTTVRLASRAEVAAFLADAGS